MTVVMVMMVVVSRRKERRAEQQEQCKGEEFLHAQRLSSSTLLPIS